MEIFISTIIIFYDNVIYGLWGCTDRHSLRSVGGYWHWICLECAQCQRAQWLCWLLVAVLSQCLCSSNSENNLWSERSTGRGQIFVSSAGRRSARIKTETIWEKGLYERGSTWTTSHLEGKLCSSRVRERPFAALWTLLFIKLPLSEGVQSWTSWVMLSVVTWP